MHTILSFITADHVSSYNQDEGLKLGPCNFKSISHSVSQFLSESLQKGLDQNKIYEAFSEPADIAQTLYVLGLCQKYNLLHETWTYNDEKLLTCFLPHSDRTDKKINKDETLTISRFSSINWEEGQCHIHSALSGGRLIIHSHLISQLLFKLTHEIQFSDWAKTSPLSEKTCLDFAQLLYEMNIINVQENTALRQWETHDLLYHRRTRTHSPFWKIGGTFRFIDQDIHHDPAVKTVVSDTVLPLYRPDIEKLLKQDMTLTEALEKRQSIREYHQTITVKELGEFLYRTARIKSVEQNGRYELIKTNYPSGGAIHETEINLIINNCADIEKGVYHYDREKHTLSRLNQMTPEAEALVAAAKFATVKKDEIQILFLLSARFQRFAWKYENMAYSTMLKHVGVIMQTFYLVATAMGLSPSSVGTGNTELSAQVLNTNFYEESSVGEFILGK